MSNVDKLKYNGVEYDLGKSIDASLTQSGQPADAKEVGDKLNSKVDKIDGKGLSSNDYTTDEKTKLAGIESGANKTLIDTTLVNTGQAADAKSVGDAIASQNTNINAIKKRTDNVEDDITTLQNNKVDKTTPLLNFDDTATDPLTDDGALVNALTALGILSDVIPSGGGSLYLKKALTELAEKLGELNSISGTVPVALKGVSDNLVYVKSGNVVTVNIVIGNGTTFSGFDGSADIGSIPEGLRPKRDSHLTGLMRTEGTWSGSTYYPCDVYITASSGIIKVRGTSAIANCKYFVCNGCYII